MTLEAARTVFDLDHFADGYPAGIEAHFWSLARNRILDGALRGLIREGHLASAPHILEVGCGPGVVVAGLAAMGHDIHGVELGRPEPLAIARSRISTGTNALDLDPDSRRDVDALLLLDVIEHVPDDAALLRQTVAAFPACRCVVVTVPARPEVWSSHDTHYGHYRRYTRETLRATFAAAGLAETGLRYMFRSLYAAAAAMKLLGQDRSPIIEAPRRPGLHSLIAQGLVWEDRLLGALPLPGLSLIGIGRPLPGRA